MAGYYESVRHYEHIQNLRSKLNDHSWCRQQRNYDSKFIAELTKRLLEIENEAYNLTQIIRGDDKS